MPSRVARYVRERKKIDSLFVDGTVNSAADNEFLTPLESCGFEPLSIERFRSWLSLVR